MKLDFYYWASMCPLNVEMQNILMAHKDHIELALYDISENPQLAKSKQMYFPTMTVLEDSSRFYSPIQHAFAERVCNGILPAEKPYRPKLGTQEYRGTIVPITHDNYHIACRCTGQRCLGSSASKAEFLRKHGISVFGFMNQSEDRLLGGAEYIPSLLVPYDVPRDERTAFITCVYLTDSEFDYKTAPLTALEHYLAGQYDRVIVVSDEIGVFPNGDLAFFLRNGYTDMGVIYTDETYCTLHLMNKRLS